jgi:hypothetical protein
MKAPLHFQCDNPTLEILIQDVHTFHSLCLCYLHKIILNGQVIFLLMTLKSNISHMKTGYLCLRFCNFQGSVHADWVSLGGGGFTPVCSGKFVPIIRWKQLPLRS